MLARIGSLRPLHSYVLTFISTSFEDICMSAVVFSFRYNGAHLFFLALQCLRMLSFSPVSIGERCCRKESDILCLNSNGNRSSNEREMHIAFWDHPLLSDFFHL
uniref:Secreted protein n=1 Tax=Ascaris lumbricoides TaxID=6252 RepID=A0A0M3IUQ2_ASCLU